MTVVTNTSIMSTMLENIITYISNNITDPAALARTTKANIIGSNAFVKLNGGRNEPFIPQILIEMPTGNTSATGLLNQMVTQTFPIRIHARSQIEAIDLTDQLFDVLRRDINDFFKNAKMYRSKDYLSSPNIRIHETDIGEWYSIIRVTFEYFQFGD